MGRHSVSQRNTESFSTQGRRMASEMGVESVLRRYDEGSWNPASKRKLSVGLLALSGTGTLRSVAVACQVRCFSILLGIRERPPSKAQKPVAFGADLRRVAATVSGSTTAIRACVVHTWLLVGKKGWLVSGKQHGVWLILRSLISQIHSSEAFMLTRLTNCHGATPSTVC